MDLSHFNLVGTVDLDQWYQQPVYRRYSWLYQQLQSMYQTVYEPSQRILLNLSKGDEYQTLDCLSGNIVKDLVKCLWQLDISAFFIMIKTPDADVQRAVDHWRSTGLYDAVPLTVILDKEEHYQKRLVEKAISVKQYSYNDSHPLHIKIEDLTDTHKKLLHDSRTFCIYPWIHLHAYPTGEAWPCCQAEMRSGSVGNCKQQSLEEIWNGAAMKQLRTNMLDGISSELCNRCYEQEDSGFFSGRQSANKHHGHHVGRVDLTTDDGFLPVFEMTYWDIRFSNLCNLRCRSCGHIFSSQWYQDQAKLAGPEWKAQNRVLNYAGRTEIDMWEQLLPHIDSVEQIYFAGGEPLLMEEHYRILEELERRERFDVRLIYNTNFTEVKLKNRSVFDYWKKFESVAVGASLDAMGDKAEYIRKGTDWNQVVRNREQMLKICPGVDFYISPTLSIMNAWHVSDFHRDWVERGLIRPQDLNVNILQDPAHYRIDIAPIKYKQRLRGKWEEHLAWLRDRDPLQRATVGFESAIRFMMATDNTHLIDNFWRRTHQLDDIRNERLLAVLPELEALL